jgi:DtxR family Mn-dependent transcriptional regulator
MTVAIQDYVKAIFFLSRDDEPVNTKRIAKRLRSSQPAVSKMLKMLAEKGIVEHTPYYGAKLTKKGEDMALEVIRHHRLIERYLVEHLGFSEDEVHDQAEILEHHISEEFEAKIADLMGHPETCPHGSPIPEHPKKEKQHAKTPNR